MGSPLAERGAAKFLAYFEELKKLHQAKLGRPLEMYKGTEPECLVTRFDALLESQLRGPFFVAEMIHQLAWGQCLGNGNHRTTVLFVSDFLDANLVRFPSYLGESDGDGRFEKELNRWIDRSQALVRRRGEFGYAQARLEPRHREITLEMVTEMAGAQSEALTMMGPQRLMNFIS